MNTPTPNNLSQRLSWTLLIAVACSSGAQAQFNAIGFEGQTIRNIPYATNVGIPAGVPVNQAFNYTFKVGNNLMGFTSNTGGNIADTDDVGGDAGTSVPDYYRSPEFLWRTDGFRSTPLNSSPWDTGFDNTFYPTPGGGPYGHNFPGAPAGRQDNVDGQWSENFNVNRLYSVAAGNLPKAPGLGDQFLDTHLTQTGTTSSQFSLSFTAGATMNLFATVAFGGRDANSATAQSWYRIYNVTTSTQLVEGSTADVPFESWDGPIDAPFKRANDTTTGVVQSDWEYFKFNFAVTSGDSYKLQIFMREEINFDMVIGDEYTNISRVDGGLLVPVPEPSTFGPVGVALLGACALLRRRRTRSVSPVGA